MGLTRWIVLIGIFVSPCQNLFAQTSDWAVVAHLLPGQKVRIETTNGKPETGDVKSVTDDSIRIGKTHLIQKQDVQRVSLKGGNHRGRNALIGFGAGAGLGFATAMTCTGKGFDWDKKECLAIAFPFFGARWARNWRFGRFTSRSRWQEIYRSK